ncbi:MAG TPA: PKD domain-containing protein [Acidobacteriota bacterium]|nr:PKD domain-containing protein [Acidobacteriota bacterium]HNT17398.1 PKD domain-containing protein [Acidobacteriota bacterium]
MKRGMLCLVLALAFCIIGPAALAQLNPDPPSVPVRLIFIHHSTGENWLSDDNDNAGHLGLSLMGSNYFVSDTNYGWGPDGIGDRTDIGNWWEWFRGPENGSYMAALYAESNQTCYYSRLSTNPGGENEIVMFKSCFPNSQLGGNPSDPVPSINDNPLKGQDAYSEYMTVANAKGIYIDILNYFQSHPEKLFIIICAPPLRQADTDDVRAANARALNNWLVNDYLAEYPLHNVFVFDFYNVLTSNGGGANVNDLGASSGNHHRYKDGEIEHQQTVSNNFSSYPSGDSHPSSAGGQKASGEFSQLLNIAYHCWKGDGGCPSGGTCTLSCSATVPASSRIDEPAAFSASATPSSLCTGSVAYDWDFGDGSPHSSAQDTTHTYTGEGSYAWAMTSSIGDVTCRSTGTIAVRGPQPPPSVSSVTKIGSPFRLKVYGSDLDPAILVYIAGDSSPWPAVKFKSSSSLVIKGGTSLKSLFPKGVGVQIRFVNPDGQEATFIYAR